VITRAKTRLWITYANTRYRFGSLVQNEPSRFIDELPEQFVDRSYAGGGSKNQGMDYGNGTAFERMRGWGGRNQESGPDSYRGKSRESGRTKKETPSYLPPTNRAQTKEHTPSADFAPSDTSNLQVGQKVEHLKFGFGEVLKMEGAAHNPIATVKFDMNGEKKIMLNYAKLRIVE